MFERIMGVIKLHRPTYQAIEADETATRQAAVIVALVGLLSAVSAAIAAVMANRAMSQTLPQLQEQFGELPFAIPQLSPIGAFLGALLGAFLAWLVWSALTYFIGTRLFGGQATFNETFRLLGFAQAPRLLSALSFIPCIGSLFSIAGWVWSSITSYIAVKEGLDLDNGKTIATVIISFIGVIIINLVFSSLIGLLSL